METSATRSRTVGVLQAVGAYGWWGFVTAIFYDDLIGIDAIDLVAWRVITAMPLVLLLVVINRSWSEFVETLRDWNRMRWLVLSAGLILINWFAFIWAVNTERLVHASLGYYLNPLVAVALSALVLKERLHPVQWLSVGTATIGVTILSCMIGLPWISVVLACSFPLYGLIRKQCPSSATVGLAVEMLLLLPLMVVLTIWHANVGRSGFQTGTGVQMLLLPLSGVVTMVPLLGFAAAARRLRLSTVGMLQYIAPTGQLLTAVVFFGESMERVWWITFAFVWIAILLFSSDSFLRSRIRNRTD